jgi:hypothetical protein
MKKGNILFLIAFIFLIQACSSVQQSVITKDPSFFPTKRKTILTDELACFGNMLSEYNFVEGNKPLSISIVSVTDKTNISVDSSHEIPKDMTDLALGVASNIGGPLRIAHVPTQEEIYSFYLLNVPRVKIYNYFGNYKFKHYNSGIMLYGAITEYDRVTENDKNTLNLGVDFGEGKSRTDINMSRSKISMFARMAMDFRVIFSKTSNVVNHASSTNTVFLHQNGTDYSYGISFDGQAIGQAVSFTEVDARHSAIRILIELGLMESIGKYQLIPYWKCFPENDIKQPIKIDNINELQVKDIDLDIVNKKRMEFEYGDYPFHSSGDDFKDFTVKYLPRKIDSIIFGYFHVKNEHLSKIFSLSTTNKTQGCNKLKVLLKQKEIECSFLTPYTIEGKKKKLYKVLKLYKKSNPKFEKLKDENLLKQLHKEFISKKIISPKDEMLSSNMYLALWFNAPIDELARWQPQ